MKFTAEHDRATGTRRFVLEITDGDLQSAGPLDEWDSWMVDQLSRGKTIEEALMALQIQVAAIEKAATAAAVSDPPAPPPRPLPSEPVRAPWPFRRRSAKPRP